MSFNIAPGLLIAMPSLMDPNFSRAVVLLCEHSSEGAFGLVINHPLKLTLATICEQNQMPWTGHESTCAFSGGPVHPERGWLLHDNTQRFDGTQAIGDELALTTSLDALASYGQDASNRFRLLLGYAGWGPAQLDQEIAAGAWLTAPLRTDLIFDVSAEDLWSRALTTLGINPTHLVDGGAGLN